MFNTDIQQSRPDVGPDPDYRSRLRPDSAFFLLNGPGLKNLGKTGPGPESLFNFGRSRGLCDHFLFWNRNQIGV